MANEPVLWNVDTRGVATVTVNRAEVNNAYDAALIQRLHDALDALGAGVRVLVLSGAGRHFQAGADLRWIRGVAGQSAEENERASRATALAVHRLNTLPVPTVALVFSIAETRWGLTAAIILPQLCDAVGARQVRRYALTGERFDAAEARRIGLVHEVVPGAELAAAGERMVGQLLQNAPEANAQTKALALDFCHGKLEQPVLDRLVAQHAAKRRSREAAEGLASFVEKRAARWT